MKKILLAILFISQPVLAQKNVDAWTLNNHKSVLNFVTTKNSSKTEVQNFKKLTGSIKNNIATLNVDLNSVSTGIEIRDERLRDLFFNVTKFATADVSINLANNKINKMKAGDVKSVELEATFNIHGVEQKEDVLVQVVALGKNKLLVTSKKPVVVKLQNFKLLEGVNALREIAKLKSINSAVPVTFSLIFVR